MAVAAIAIAFALPAKAQVTPFTYFNVDWQFNAPISNNFANIYRIETQTPACKILRKKIPGYAKCSM